MSILSDLWSSIADHHWSSIVEHILLSVVTPGLVAALVTAVIQHKRPDLQMIKIDQTKAVADWLARADTDKTPEAIKAKTHWRPGDIVLLTNYGKATAYDIRVSGENCRPRVFFRDTALRKLEDGGAGGPVGALPMWSNRYPALEPGKEWSLVVMRRTDESSGGRPVLEVSWRGLEFSWSRHPIRRRRTRPFDVADAPNIIETGWPGKKTMDTDAD